MISIFQRRSKTRRRQARSTRKVRLESLESRRLMAADSIGVTPTDLGELLVGRVAVTPVLFESNGQIDAESQNWTASEIQETLAKVTEGVQWWSDTLDTMNTVHTLEFIVDDTFAVDPVETPYEPIDRSSGDINLYSGDFLTDQGYGDASTIEEAVYAFNHDQRIKHDADWAFTLFIADSSDDPDGLFASGGTFAAAFALPGGLFIVTPSTRPASTIAHEMGHIFWARDEYAGGGSWTDQRGYYNQQNFNAADNPTSGFQQQISIMRGGVPLNEAYVNHVSPASTFAFVGWRDSDGDGIFDFADVPLAFDGEGSFDKTTSTFRFVGDASAVPLRNLNSSGNQSDITLNQIDSLDYRIDGGTWQSVAQYATQTVAIDESFTIDTPFETIEFRVRDADTGVTSPIISGTDETPALAASSIQGAAFFDENADGLRSEGELAYADYNIEVTQVDGTPLAISEIDAANFDEGDLPSQPVAGITLRSEGVISDTKVGVFESSSVSQNVFQSFDLQRQRWTQRWDNKVKFVATLDDPTGQVDVRVGGLDDGSYARVVGIDGDGNELTRVTSGRIESGQMQPVSLEDPTGRIRRVEVYGHAGTSVTISEFQTGVSGELEFTVGSGWTIQNLPDGDYGLNLTTDSVIHDFVGSPDVISVSGTTNVPLQLVAQRVDSPRHNTVLATDVNEDSEVTSLDALLIINDIGRFETRELRHDESDGFKIDVNNDGSVTALDALLVINSLGDGDSGEGDSGEGEFVASTANRALFSTEMTAASTDEAFRRWTNDDAPMLDLAGYDFPIERNEPIATDSTEQEGLHERSKTENDAVLPIKIRKLESNFGRSAFFFDLEVRGNS